MTDHPKGSVVLTWWSGPLLCMACMSPLGFNWFLFRMAWINWCFHKNVSFRQWLTSLTDTGFLMLFLTAKTGKFTHAI